MRSPFSHRSKSERLLPATMLVVATLSACWDASAPTGLTDGDPSPPPPPPPQTAYHQSAVVVWDDALLEAIRRSLPAPTVVARAIAITHTATYDAWSAYDSVAVPTQPGVARQPAAMRTTPNKSAAVSFAGYRAVVDLFPAQKSVADSVLAMQGYSLADTAASSDAPAAIGWRAAGAVLDYRHHDGSNQLGDLHAGAYSDYTGYTPKNTATSIADPNHWQPLAIPDGQGGTTTQKYATPQWGDVKAFGMTSGAMFRPASVPNLYPDGGYAQQVQEILDYSANLTDEHKVIAEYWADGPHSELPPGHWALFAGWVARRDRHTIDQDARMYFALGNALMDVSIAVWDCKRAFDYVRPVTAVHFLTRGQKVRAWGGPFKGTQLINGEDWQPYQPTNVVTPPFPEFSSGHSAFSSAGAEILKRITGSDMFGASVTVTAGSSRVEPGAVPAHDITLQWSTFSEAADQAAISRRYGGIHFVEGDTQSRALGRKIADLVWKRAEVYWTGSATGASALAVR